MHSLPRKSRHVLAMALLSLFFTTIFALPSAAKETAAEGGAKLGVIKGVVRDKSGKPISKATVAVFAVGTSKLLKQVTSSKAGKFFTKLLPGTYTILAVAQGFNPVTLDKVQVRGASELVYGFNLERAGQGNTLPEKRVDRLSPKNAIRAARRSIYQAGDGDAPETLADGSADAGGTVDQAFASRTEEEPEREGQTVVETFFASTKNGNFTGVNFATLRPIGQDKDLVIAGQGGIGANAPARVEATFSMPAGNDHKMRFRGSLSRLADIVVDKNTDVLGQISVQALDQWNVREGLIFVFGVDYSRFIGAGSEQSISPRLGFQYDIDGRTRMRAAYTTENEPRTWRRVIELEDSHVLFREPTAVRDVVIENSIPKLNRSSRLEFGIERVIDNRSTVEANVFFDTVSGRGVGLDSIPFNGLAEDGVESFVAEQQGKAQGFRLVYNRRINGIFSTAAGYSVGRGQKLSTEAVSDPESLFEHGAFQTFFGQISADVRSGTNVRTIFRLSPQATVFAIDPFEGRLAIYDPSLSVMVTQDIPNWGLPIDAEAILDARNLFDFHSGITGEGGSLMLNSQRRMLRGGILVRF